MSVDKTGVVDAKGMVMNKWNLCEKELDNWTET
jgi:hypothetical protein